MPIASVFDMTGAKTGEMELNAAVFGIEPNEVVLTLLSRIISQTRDRALSPP